MMGDTTETGITPINAPTSGNTVIFTTRTNSNCHTVIVKVIVI
jgi:hypothetical protein